MGCVILGRAFHIIQEPRLTVSYCASPDPGVSQCDYTITVSSIIEMLLGISKASPFPIFPSSKVAPSFVENHSVNNIL